MIKDFTFALPCRIDSEYIKKRFHYCNHKDVWFQGKGSEHTGLRFRLLLYDGISGEKSHTA